MISFYMHPFNSVCTNAYKHLIQNKKLVDVIEQWYECKIGCSSFRYIVQQQARSFQSYLFLSSFASDDVLRLYEAPEILNT